MTGRNRELKQLSFLGGGDLTESLHFHGDCRLFQDIRPWFLIDWTQCELEITGISLILLI